MLEPLQRILARHQEAGYPLAGHDLGGMPQLPQTLGQGMAPAPQPVAQPAPAPAPSPSPASPATNALSPTQALNNFANSAGMQFQMDQGLNALSNHYAAHGALLSGAAGKAFQDFGQKTALNNYFMPYLNALQGQQSVGAGAASSIAGVGQNFGNTISNINGNMANAIGQGALNIGNANANNAAIGGLANANLGSTIGNALGNLGSSFLSPTGGTANQYANSVAIGGFY